MNITLEVFVFMMEKKKEKASSLKYLACFVSTEKIDSCMYVSHWLDTTFLT